MSKNSVKAHDKFNAVFPAKNMQAHNKRKGELALEKAKNLEEAKINKGMVWVKDPKTKSRKLIKINADNTKN